MGGRGTGFPIADGVRWHPSPSWASRNYSGRELRIVGRRGASAGSVRFRIRLCSWVRKRQIEPFQRQARVKRVEGVRTALEIGFTAC